MSSAIAIVVMALAATGASALLAGDPLWWVGFLTEQLANLAGAIVAEADAAATTP